MGIGMNLSDFFTCRTDLYMFCFVTFL
jgi:hypothetical protein